MSFLHLLPRIFAKVRVVDGPLPTPCFVWQGGKKPGRASLQGTISVKGKTHAVHRLVLETFQGQPTAEKPFALHACDNGLCCNPVHLRWGTHQENVEERHERGRQKTSFDWFMWFRLGQLHHSGWSIASTAGALGLPVSTVRDAVSKAYTRGGGVSS